MSDAAAAAPVDAAPADAPADAGQAADAPPPMPRKLPAPVEIKFKGRVERVDDIDQLAKLAQMGRGATAVFEEAKRMRAEAEEKASRLEKLKGGSWEDRLSLLTETLGDEEAALQFMEEALYAKRVQPQQLTPEQRKLMEYERKLASYEQEKAAQAKAQQEKQLEAQADEIANQYARTAAEVMQKLGWGPELAPLVLREMLPYAEQALEAGLEPVSEDILSMFMEDQQSKLSNFARQLEGESLLRFLGDDIANKVRKADLARLRGGNAPKAQPRQEAKPEKPLPEDPLEAERERQRRRRSFWESTPYK